MKFIISLLLISFLFFNGYGQSLFPEILSSSGGESEAGDTRLSWTIGEVLIEEYTNSEVQLNGGYQQVVWITTESDNGISYFQLNIYPNPVMNYLTVEMSQSNVPLNYPYLNLSIYDNMGNLMFKRQVPTREMPFLVDLSSYEVGVYFLRLSNHPSTSFKVIKLIKIH